jgi:hypothetical protein
MGLRLLIMAETKVMSPEDYEEQRRQTWLTQVDLWAGQHGLTRKQAISVLRGFSYDQHDHRELFKWVGYSGFIHKTWAEVQDADQSTTGPAVD